MKSLYKISQKNVIDEYDTKVILSHLGVNIPKGYVLADDILPDTPFPCVLKVVDSEILHKSDISGVILNIKDADQLRQDIQMMRKRFPKKRLLIEEMVPDKLEVILGTNLDSTFGQVLMIGLGGISAEIFNAVSFGLIPVNRSYLYEMIDEGPLGKIKDGFRGTKIDIEKLIDYAIVVSDFVHEFRDQVRTLDINPLVFTGDDWYAVDSKIVLRDVV
ncbi:MAG: acetate--CoA ligase family protein [Candidatus Thermoplasmatota archaeon]|nr:acetate--CoA ligase family protein [Candidatus Thermoplasmatota archaeon]